jgi:hypothetical protein
MVQLSTIPSQGRPQPVASFAEYVTATYERPANATAYAAKDTVADETSGAAVLTFSNVVAYNGGWGDIVGAFLATDQTANVAEFRLHLYNSAPTALQDNAACTAPLFADLSKYLAYYHVYQPRFSFKCAAASMDIYGILETLTAFTPASEQDFTIYLLIARN